MKTKDEIWEESCKRNSTLRNTWRDAMEEYAGQQLPTEEEIDKQFPFVLKNKGLCDESIRLYNNDMRIKREGAKWVLSKIKQI